MNIADLLVACLPVTPKVLLLWRYLTVAMVRVGCIVAGVGAIIGVVGMMNHYHAEMRCP